MNIADLAYLVEVIRLHCAPRNYSGKGTEIFPIDHTQMANASQQIFQLFPRKIPVQGDERRKLIEQRVTEIINPGYSDEEFKILSDMVETVFINWMRSKKTKKAKYKIGTLREKLPRIYNEIMHAQSYRCVFCGYQFHEDGDMHLDHIIPYNLGGDTPYCGSNWQLLCANCNEGKKDLFTVFQYLGRQDWIYPLKNWFPEKDSRENWKRFRLIALIRDGECSCCARSPREVQLTAINTTKGVSISSNLICVCEDYPDCRDRI